MSTIASDVHTYPGAPDRQGGTITAPGPTWTRHTPTLWHHTDRRSCVWEHDAITKVTRLSWWPGKRDYDQELLDVVHAGALALGLTALESGWRQRAPTSDDGPIIAQIDSFEYSDPAELVSLTYAGHVPDGTTQFVDPSGDDIGWDVHSIARWIPVRELDTMIQKANP